MLDVFFEDLYFTGFGHVYIRIDETGWYEQYQAPGSHIYFYPLAVLGKLIYEEKEIDKGILNWLQKKGVIETKKRYCVLNTL
jgi:hypothetical protein